MNYIGGKAAKGSGRVNADRQVLKEETFKCTDPNGSRSRMAKIPWGTDPSSLGFGLSRMRGR
jgi:hypothetical protein